VPPRRLLALLAVAALGLAGASATPAGAGSPSPPAIGHVFIIVLENENAEVTFGPDSPATYLSRDLPSQGQLISEYYGIGHVSLDNYIAMVSGQAPNPQTQSDCQIFTDFLPGVIGPDGQAIGQGCVFPAGVLTIADQLEAAGKTWRGYMDDMGEPCRHPAIGAQDDTESAEVGDQYATRHNPFMYFHSIIDDASSCAAHVVDLEALAGDLASAATTPNLAFITPDLCHDGHDEPCVDGQPGGLVSADAFLAALVPTILASSAYQQDGMLIITFDEAETGGPATATACCGEVPGPNSPSPGITGPGGGKVGAVVLSRFITPGSVNATPYNHYALLRSLEDIFGLDHLGFAAAAGLRAFGPDVFGAVEEGGATTTSTSGASTGGGSRGRDLPATGDSPDGLPLLLLVVGAGLVLLAGARRLTSGGGAGSAR
jgi:hypothetical protein